MNLFNFLFRGATVFLPDRANIRRSREQCKYICIDMFGAESTIKCNGLFREAEGLFRPDGPGGPGLTDTTGETCYASLTACVAEA